MKYQQRALTPYTEAVIHEIQRCGNIVPMGVVHSASVDTELFGYKFPKGTQIIPYLNDILHDPVTFPDPTRLDPHRHLNSDGKFVPHHNVIPFSVGKRRCLGETLAKVELYRFFAGIMQRFDVCKIDENAVLTLDRYFGQAQTPKEFQVRLISRT